MQIHLITLFPGIFKALNEGITGRAIAQRLLNLTFWNPRDYALDNYKTVDDKSYGGGPGMVLKPEPLMAAISAAKATGNSLHTIYFSPQGKRLIQSDLPKIMARTPLVLICGRYEGIDERVVNLTVDEEWSIGDYVLSGGELPAMVLIDAMTRLLPGALHDEQSAQEDSFMQGLLDYPHYTRPENFSGHFVPEVLKSGDHKAIKRWRLKQALGRTWLRRPDLLIDYPMTEEMTSLLAEFIADYKDRSKKP